jgi:hypothetical protein
MASKMDNTEKLRSLNAMRDAKRKARKAGDLIGRSRMVCDLDTAKDIIRKVPYVDRDIIAGYIYRTNQIAEIRKKTKLADLQRVADNLIKCEREIFASERMKMRADGDWYLNMFLLELIDVMRALIKHLFTPPSWYRQ